MRIISPILVEVLIGLLILVCAEEPTTKEPIHSYEFGFNDGLSTRQEEQTADGVVKGSYSYIDAFGNVQKVSYSADAVNGYVVHPEKDDRNIAIPTAATSIGKEYLEKTYNQGPKKPVEISRIEVVNGHIVDTPEVAAAKAIHLKAYREAELNAAKDKQQVALRRTPGVVQPKIIPQKTLVKTLEAVRQNSIPHYGTRAWDSIRQRDIPQVKLSQPIYQSQHNTIYTPEVAAARDEHFRAVQAAERLAKDNRYVEPITLRPTTVATPILVRGNDNGLYTPEVQAARDEHFRAVQYAQQQGQQQSSYVNPTVPSYVPQGPHLPYVPSTSATYTNYIQPTAGIARPTLGQQLPTVPNSLGGITARVNQYQSVPQGQQTYQNDVPHGYRNAYTPLTIYYK